MSSKQPHPFAGGGGGTLFEYKVATVWATNILTSSRTPLGGLISSIAFQTENVGFDDLEVQCELIEGGTRRIHCQARYRQPLVASNKKFVELMAAGWELLSSDEFAFTAGRRRLLLAVADQSPGHQSMSKLCSLAREVSDSTRFEVVVARHGKHLRYRLDQCQKAIGLPVDEVHRLLRAMDILGFELDAASGRDVITALNDLARLWVPTDHPAADNLMCRIFWHMTELGPSAGIVDLAFLRSSLPEHVPATIGAATRRARLERSRSESHARVAARLRGIGVPDHLVSSVADHALSSQQLPNAEGPVAVLVGAMGIGKSTMLERLHQASIEGSLSDETAPIPIFVDARELQGSRLKSVASQKASGLGDPAASGAVVVVDSLDEAGFTVGQVALEAYELVAAWPHTKVWLATRPQPDLGSIEVVEVTAMSDEDMNQLFNLLGWSNVWFAYARKPISEIVHRPMFAIRTALARNLDVGWSHGRIIADLGQYAASQIGVDRVEAFDLLTRLGAELVENGGKPVSPAEIGATPFELRELGKSRIIQADENGINFQLAALTEWFAAHHLLYDLGRIEQIIASPERIERWKYALVQVLLQATPDQVDAVLTRLLAQTPSWVAWILDEASFPDLRGQRSPLGRSDALIGNRIRSVALALWTPFRALPVSVAALDAQRDLVPLGVRTSEVDHLTTAWYRGEDDLDGVVELPSEVNLEGHSEDWNLKHSGRPKAGSVWPWYWVQDEMEHPLRELILKSNRLLAEIELFEAELAWDFATRMVKHRRGSSLDPVSVEMLQAKVDEVTAILPDARDVGVSNGDWRLSSGKRFIAELRRRGTSEVVPPWPGPNTSATHISDYWTIPRLLKRVTRTTLVGLKGFQELVERYFPTFASDFKTYRLLPAELVGYITPRNTNDEWSEPEFTWYLRPTPGREMAVTWSELDASEPIPGLDWEDRHNVHRRLRPGRFDGIPLTVHHGDAEVYSSTPAGGFALHLLREELAHFKWLSSPTSGYRMPAQLPLAGIRSS